MKRAFDSYSVRFTLQRGINAGHWTLADLDQPSRGWLATQEQTCHIPAFTHPPHRNLLRDQPPTEAVQPISPRDFDVAAIPRANEGSRNLDLLPQRWPPEPQVPDLSNRGDLSSYQDLGTNGSDHGQTLCLGSSWQHHPPSAGTLRQPSLEPGDYLDDPTGCEF